MTPFPGVRALGAKCAAAAALLLCSAGCATQADIDAAVADDVRFTTRVIGFALDADLEALETRLAILRAFEGDPRAAALQKELGSPGDVEAKIERVREARRGLLEEAQRLQRRYGIESTGTGE